MNESIEYIGYAASFFVLLSFLMKKMTTLRLVNIVGCALFIWYGVMLNSIPIIITNCAILIVNIYYLLKTKAETSN
ncbi:MAG: YgjV family protein [Flavobacteriales bacterium]|nr:YgjV family protein [Flavobacteriales bacterium]